LHAFLKLVHPEDREMIAAAVRRAHDPSGDGIWDVEHRIIRRDGTVRWLKERSQTFFEGEGDARRPVRTVGAVLDITERRRAEEEHERLQAQLFQSQKMESVGQLAGGIAHDFNNILAAIIGYGNLLQMKIPVNDPLRYNVDHMLESAERAAQLTHSLLTFSRKQVLKIKPTHLNGIIAGQGQFLRRIIGEDVEIKSILRGDAVIMADSGQIEQVLMNLATNARDAMPRGGQLTVETDLLEITDAFISAHGFGIPGPYAVISVTDTGIGMDEEAKQKIYEPFFTTKEVGRGTGLGMAIVYGIVKQHKGYINVSSQVGKGTTFKIYLPVHSGQVEQREKSPAASPVMTGTETILLAEDDAALRKFFTNVLTEYGYTVVVAENGEEAIRKFFERMDEIQLCVVDMIMPKKSGREVFEAVQKMKPGTKVIFSSGYTADKVQQEGLPAGSEFIAKPAPPQQFLKKIREVLENSLKK
jgi:signal transduction histidine kinase